MKTNKIVAGFFAGALLSGLSACLLPVGDGVGLDADGNPIPEVLPPPPDTNLTLIYSNVITASGSFCLSCHSGSNPEGQFNLSNIANMRAALATIGADTVWQLTTRLSSQQPRYRVLPFEPDSSLLYKIVAENNPKGDYPRMPRNLPPLSAPKIELLRRWIALGASLQ